MGLGIPASPSVTDLEQEETIDEYILSAEGSLRIAEIEAEIETATHDAAAARAAYEENDEASASKEAKFNAAADLEQEETINEYILSEEGSLRIADIKAATVERDAAAARAAMAAAANGYESRGNQGGCDGRGGSKDHLYEQVPNESKPAAGASAAGDGSGGRGNGDGYLGGLCEWVFKRGAAAQARLGVGNPAARRPHDPGRAGAYNLRVEQQSCSGGVSELYLRFAHGGV